ncbi:protein of unknown function (plasmid) [Thermococcus nautili]|nr:protein of unknown function [Thermococcus nautili]
MRPSEEIRFSKEEMEVLYPIYVFQKKRHFRYGLRREYAIEEAKFRGVKDPEAVIEALIGMGVLFPKRPYNGKSYEYLLLTKKGRRAFERQYPEWLGIRRGRKVRRA